VDFPRAEDIAEVEKASRRATLYAHTQKKKKFHAHPLHPFQLTGSWHPRPFPFGCKESRNFHASYPGSKKTPTYPQMPRVPSHHRAHVVVRR